jgi:hypothetical protein
MTGDFTVGSRSHNHALAAREPPPANAATLAASAAAARALRLAAARGCSRRPSPPRVRACSPLGFRSNNDIIALRARGGRLRRPSAGSGRFRAWTSLSPTSALKARGLRAVLDSTSTRSRTLHNLDLYGNDINTDIGICGDRLRANKLVLKVDAWAASAVARRVELWDDILVIPPAVAACAAVLAFGDELMDLKLPDDLDSRGSRRAVTI